MKNQRGVSYVGIFFGVIVLLLAFQAFMVVWPVYYDDYAISKNIQESLDNGSANIGEDELKRELTRRLDMNNIRDVKVDDIMVFTPDSAGMKVRKKYEIRKNYFKNLYLLMSFDTTYQKGKESVNNAIDEATDQGKASEKK